MNWLIDLYWCMYVCIIIYNVFINLFIYLFICFDWLIDMKYIYIYIIN